MAFSIVWGYGFWLLPIRWAVPTALTFSTLLAGQLLLQADLPPSVLPSWIAAFGMLIVIGLFVAFWINGIIRQSRQRQQLIEELEATRRELAEAERHAGMLEERQRLAREIHDTLAQGFISVVMHLEAAESVLPPGAEMTHKHLDQARQTARESLAEARRMIWANRPDLLEQASLPEALAHVITRWKAETGQAAELAITGTPGSLPPDVEVTLLRATQEALANVRKHARAGQVNVTLSYMSDVLTLDVHDDGSGLELAMPTGEGLGIKGGFGLIAMRERVEQLGGSLLVESTPGEGTTVVIEIPLSTQ
jgi:signal transduction histidine kinase